MKRLTWILLVATAPSVEAVLRGPSEEAVEEWSRYREEAVAHYTARRFGPAEMAWLNALRAAKRVGPEDPTVAAALVGLGIVKLEQWEDSSAATFLLEALRIYRNCGDPCLVGQGEAYRHLGALRVKQNRFEEANDYLKRSLSLQERTAASNTDQLLMTLDSLGTLSVIRNELGTAETYFRRAISLARRTSPLDSTLATLHFGLGNLLLRVGRYSEAASALQQSLELFTRCLGPKHPDLAIVEAKLGSAAIGCRDYTLAEMHIDRALELLSSVKDNEQVDRGVILHDYGMMRFEQGRLEEAERMLLDGIRIISRHFQADHPEILDARANYAAILRKMGRKADAKQVEVEIREARQRQKENSRGGHTVDYRTLRAEN